MCWAERFSAKLNSKAWTEIPRLFYNTYFLGYLIEPYCFSILILLSTESSSSCVKCPSLLSNCLLIILMIGSCVTFGGFPSKFSKSCFHSGIRSCWLVALSLALAVLFLQLTSFTVCYVILDCLSSTEYRILLIWFCMYSDCSFRYMLANSFCTFLSFRALVLVGFLRLHLEAVFPTVNVTHWALNEAKLVVSQ